MATYVTMSYFHINLRYGSPIITLGSISTSSCVAEGIYTTDSRYCSSMMSIVSPIGLPLASTSAYCVRPLSSPSFSICHCEISSSLASCSESFASILSISFVTVSVRALIEPSSLSTSVVMVSVRELTSLSILSSRNQSSRSGY